MRERAGNRPADRMLRDRATEARAAAVAGPRLHGVGADSWDDPTTTTWWQREFTDGVDPEYTEQIIPLVVDRPGRCRPAAGHRHRRGAAGPLRWPRERSGATTPAIGATMAPSRARGVDRLGSSVSYPVAATAVLRPPGAGEWCATPGPTPPPCPFADDSLRRCAGLPGVRAHRRRRRGPSPRSPGCCGPGGRFLFLLNHPLLQTPGSGWIDDQLLDPPEQYWRVGPYLPEADTLEEVQKGVFIRFIHRPLSRYVNALADVGLTITRMDEPAPPPAFLAQAPWYAAAHTIPRLLALVCERRSG